MEYLKIFTKKINGDNSNVQEEKNKICFGIFMNRVWGSNSNEITRTTHIYKDESQTHDKRKKSTYRRMHTVWDHLHIGSKTCKMKPYIYWHTYVISIETHRGTPNTYFRIVTCVGRVG